MALRSKGIFIIGAKRTPFCKHSGPFRELPAYHIFATAAKDAIQTAKLDPALIDNTVVGNVNFLSQCDGGKTPRYCGLFSGVPIERPALGVNRTCGTGLQAIVTGAMDIHIGTSQVALTGGTELMSSLPLLVRNVRFGTTLGVPYKLEDHIRTEFLDSLTGLTLQKMAEDLAVKYGVTREEVDQFALNSHLKWKAAQESNIFADEMTSVTVTSKNKETIVSKDEAPRADISAEDLSQLPAIVQNGTIVTSGNSTTPADGAASLLLASEEAVKSHQLQPLGRIAGWASVGVDPLENGLGAIPAVEMLLNALHLTVDDIDLFEINETFASQALISAKQLNVDLSKVNVNGGAVALGHPVAATGARMATHLLYELRRRNKKRGIAASSCGGGQGLALALEIV